MLLRNAWYIAAWADEIGGDQPLARRTRPRSIRQKSFGARRRRFDRYLSSGLGRSQSSQCRGQRQSHQVLCRESCDRKGDAGSLPRLSKPLSATLSVNQPVPAAHRPNRPYIARSAPYDPCRGRPCRIWEVSISCRKMQGCAHLLSPTICLPARSAAMEFSCSTPRCAARQSG